MAWLALAFVSSARSAPAYPETLPEGAGSLQAEIETVLAKGWRRPSDELRQLVSDNQQRVAAWIAQGEAGRGGIWPAELGWLQAGNEAGATFGRLVLLDARRAEVEDRYEDMVARYLGVLELAFHLRSQGPPEPSGWVASEQLEDLAVQRIAELVRRGGPTQESWQLLARELPRLAERRASIAEVNARVRREVFDSVRAQLCADGAPLDRWAASALDRCADLERELERLYARCVELDDPEPYERALDPIRTELRSLCVPGDVRAAVRARIDSQAHRWLALGLESGAACIDADLVRRTSLDMLIAAIAVRRFIDSRGSVPSTLEEIVPEYLERVPRDPFDSGAGLRLVVRGPWRLASAGPDRSYDGGRRAWSPSDPGLATDLLVPGPSSH